jgi:hypothetical protein
MNRIDHAFHIIPLAGSIDRETEIVGQWKHRIKGTSTCTACMKVYCQLNPMNLDRCLLAM